MFFKQVNKLCSIGDRSANHFGHTHDCLPSVDAWRDQWLAHKKAIVERERLHALKREISQGKKEGLKDKESGTTKDLKKDAKPEKKKASGSSGSASKVIEKAKGKVKESGKEEVQSNTVTEKKGGVETIGEGDNSEKINQIEVAPVQTIGSGKKKVIRKVIKKKVVEKDKAEKAAEQSDSLVPKKVEETTTNTEASGRDEESSGNPSAVKTFTRKKLIKKVPVATAVKKKDESTQSEVIPVKEQESSENKPKNADAGSASGKTTVKKKIIKRVTKRKVVVKNKDKVAEEAGITIREQSSTLGNKESEVKLEGNESVSKTKAPSVVPKKNKNGGDDVKNENKGENDRVKEEKKGKVDSGSSSKLKSDNEKLKDGGKSKEGKVRKDNDGKAESKGKEVKDKKKDEEPPGHPGLFLQTKENNNSKLRSLSLSLDSLLGYDDNDIEESTFEIIEREFS